MMRVSEPGAHNHSSGFCAQPEGSRGENSTRLVQAPNVAATHCDFQVLLTRVGDGDTEQILELPSCPREGAGGGGRVGPARIHLRNLHGRECGQLNLIIVFLARCPSLAVAGADQGPVIRSARWLPS